MGQDRNIWTPDGPSVAPQKDDVARLERIRSLWLALELTKVGSLEYHGLISRIRIEADAFSRTLANPLPP